MKNLALHIWFRHFPHLQNFLMTSRYFFELFEFRFGKRLYSVETLLAGWNKKLEEWWRFDLGPKWTVWIDMRRTDSKLDKSRIICVQFWISRSSTLADGILQYLNFNPLVLFLTVHFGLDLIYLLLVYFFVEKIKP